MLQALTPGHASPSHACTLCRGPCTRRRRVAPILSPRFYVGLLNLWTRRSATRGGDGGRS